MPKFLALASYTSEGIKGLTRAGGTARRAVADKLLKSLGGRLEGFYFAFGENAAYVIFDVPDNSTAAAISLAVAETGVIRIQTIVLLTPEEMDQAMKKPVHYEPPGWEVQEVATDIDRLIGEGGKTSVHKKEEALCLELGTRSDLAYCYWKLGLLAREQRDRNTEREKFAAALVIFTDLKMPLERDAVEAELEKTAAADRAT